MKSPKRSRTYSSSNLVVMTWKVTTQEDLILKMREWDQTLKSSKTTFSLFPGWMVAFEIEGNLKTLTLVVRLWPDIATP